MSQPSIPIENIYYLFCYAWNRFEEAQTIPIGGIESPDLPNLLAHVLLTGMRSLLRRGLDRAYLLHEEEITTVRGHIDLAPSLRLRARNVRRLHCEFDELSHDVLHNQILKASLCRLARASTLSSDLAKELTGLARRMPDVSDIWLERQAFGRVQLHRNNACYSFLLKVAELAYDCLLPDPRGSGLSFHDVLRDERKMARVFEDFVRNFYRTEQRTFAVEPLTIEWDATRISQTGVGRLPNMRVDIFLRAPARRIIIDTKYYANVLQRYYGSESFHSGNMYQIFSYLKNAAGVDSEFIFCEGMLLYPSSGISMNEKFDLQGHPISIRTVDLAQSWQKIHDRLIAILELF